MSLERSNHGMIGGVCGGLANYIGIDPTIVRILTVIISFGTAGVGILPYIIMWALMPLGND